MKSFIVRILLLVGVVAAGTAAMSFRSKNLIKNRRPPKTIQSSTLKTTDTNDFSRTIKGGYVEFKEDVF